jgi:glucan biosynthesis protein C
MSAQPTTSVVVNPVSENSRLDYLDATRAFALILGIIFHASLSFMPVFIGWAVQDVSTSSLVSVFCVVSHSFRMETFFLLAGFFGHMTFHRQGAVAFMRSRAVRILVPFIVGWFLLRPLIVSGWIMGSASLRGDYDFWAGIKAGVLSLANLPSGIFAGSHLWFLFYLALITTLTLLVRGALGRSRALYAWLVHRVDACVAWLADSPLSIPVLVIPTAGALWFMRFWGMDTPDQTLTPHIPVLLVYGGFFGLGWVFDRQRDIIAGFAQLSPWRWILAGLGIVGSLWLSRFERDPGHVNHTAAHVGFVVSYALMMWSLVGLTLGLFRKFAANPRPVIRYLADSSYWLYLIHLPIVVWLQVAVAEVPLHWSLKLSFISIVTLAIALLTYDLFVRSTIIGQVLNGRRRTRVLSLTRRASRKEPATARPAAS